MASLAEQCLQQAVDIKNAFCKLAGEVRDEKGRCRDPKAQEVLTNVQAALFGLGADLEGLKATIAAARMTGGLDPRPAQTRAGAAYPDVRMAAAHDLSLAPEGDGNFSTLEGDEG